MASGVIKSDLIRTGYMDANSSLNLSIRSTIGLAAVLYKRNDNYGVIFIEKWEAGIKEIGSQTGKITVAKSNSSNDFTISNSLAYGMPMIFINC